MGLNIDEFDATKDTILLFLIRGAWVLIMDQYNLPYGIEVVPCRRDVGLNPSV